MEIAVETAVEELVSTALILDTDTPSSVLAVRLAEENSDVAAELGHHLVLGYLTRLIRANRAKSRQSRQYVLPGFDPLPLRIRVSAHRTCPTDESTYTDWRARCWFLASSHQKRRRNDPRLKQARRIRDLLYRRSRHNRGIKLGEIFGELPQSG